MKLEGLAWAGAASKAALKRMLEDEPGAATGKPVKASGGSQPVLHFRERRDPRKRAISGALWLAGLFCLVVAFALLAALVIERYL